MPEPNITHHLTPHGVGEIEVGVDGYLAGCAICPQQGAIIPAVKLPFFQDRDIRKIQPPGLKISLARICFGGDKTAADNGHFHHINIGQLHAFAVYAVVIRITHKQ